MASERAHKIDGAVRKLRAVMEAFDMKGTNRATMLNAINTINALNTRPAPAATDTGLASVGEVSTVRESIAAFAGHMLSRQLKPGDLLCLQSQAEELLVAERANCRKVIEDYHTLATNASKRADDLESKLADAEKALEEVQTYVQSQRTQLDVTDPEYWAKYQTLKDTGTKIREARAVLGGKPS